MNILLFGDAVGKPGRQAITLGIEAVRKNHTVDLIIANVENLSHGFGITPDTIEELEEAGVDLFTSGNHIWKNAKGVQLMELNPPHILRPANEKMPRPGNGFIRTEVNGVPLLLINLLGEAFMKDEVDLPSSTFDQIYAQHGGDDVITIVDLHAEATGEKKVFGWYVDGRATIVVGTHTHVQTADEQILTKGTAYITDLGMNGAYISSLGMDKDLAMDKIIHKLDISLEPPTNPEVVVASGALVTIDEETRTATAIERIDLRFSV